MTVREVLNLMDNEVWVRVRVNDVHGVYDLVLRSSDWIGGGEDDPGMPERLADVLEWCSDDLTVELHADIGPEKVPMIVVNAYPVTDEHTHDRE